MAPLDNLAGGAFSFLGSLASISNLIVALLMLNLARRIGVFETKQKHQDDNAQSALIKIQLQQGEIQTLSRILYQLVGSTANARDTRHL